LAPGVVGFEATIIFSLIMHQLYLKQLVPRLTGGLLLSLLLGSCMDSNQPEPAPPLPGSYELTEVRYFLGGAGGLDTVAVPLPGLQLQNPGTTLATQQVDLGVTDLVKISHFTLDPSLLLPANVELSRLSVQVPQEWGISGPVSYFRAPFALSVTPQQQPYGPYAQQLLTVQLPAKSKLDISRHLAAYHLTCSLQGLLLNKNTGQRYPLRGTWKGLLHYNKLSTTVTQSPL
jgi:hypothetical protein